VHELDCITNISVGVKLVCRTNITCTKCFLHISSPICFGTTHMPSSGSLRSCYHNAIKWPVVC